MKANRNNKSNNNVNKPIIIINYVWDNGWMKNAWMKWCTNAPFTFLPFRKLSTQTLNRAVANMTHDDEL